MTDTRRRGMKLEDYVRELTETHSHAEHYVIRERGAWTPRDHTTRVPSLLAQLWENDVPSQSAESGSRPGFASKPAARLDALDTAVRIDLEAHRWVADMGEPVRSGDTQQVIRQLHGLLPSADLVTRRQVEHDVRRWWTRARIVTGWDSPAWTPDATCPQCGERGTLKVRLAERIAMCTNDACAVTWDEASIGLLADHIRAESSAKRRTAAGVGPCWCPFPAPRIPDDQLLDLLCRRCGSARCRHALAARLLRDLEAMRQAGRGDVA